MHYSSAAEPSTIPSTGSCHPIGKPTDVFLILMKDLSINQVMEFGVLLGLTNPELDMLKENSGGKGAAFINKIAETWYNKTPPPACWETIYDALWELPNRPLANKVKEKHMTA